MSGGNRHPHSQVALTAYDGVSREAGAVSAASSPSHRPGSRRALLPGDVVPFVGVGFPVVQRSLGWVRNGTCDRRTEALVLGVDQLVAVDPIAEVGQSLIDDVLVLPGPVGHAISGCRCGGVTSQAS